MRDRGSVPIRIAVMVTLPCLLLPSCHLLMRASAEDEVARREALVAHAGETLALMENGSLGEARERLERMPRLFSEQPGEPVIRELLRARLARLYGIGGPRTRSPLVGPLAPDQAETFSRRARLATTRGDLDHAWDLLERAHALDPGSRKIVAALVAVLQQLGLELYGSGRIEQAIRRWERVLEVSPTDQEARQFLRRAKQVRGKL